MLDPIFAMFKEQKIHIMHKVSISFLHIVFHKSPSCLLVCSSFFFQSSAPLISMLSYWTQSGLGVIQMNFPS